ncbi:MAG: amino acid permease [Clostridiales bacterium]|nr:amino acid permease [Clostridiales bacterium]
MDKPTLENGLERKLGLFPLTNIVIANMIGAGIFTTSGLLMTGLKSPLLMLSLWAVGGLIALCGALSYGELGAAMPRAGGEYAFLSRLFHPLFGFLSGWVSFFAGFSAPIAASAIGFSEYLTRAFPGLPGPGKKFYSILVILVFTFVHSRGIEVGARVQNFLTLLKVGLILGLVIFGFSIGEGSLDHLSGGDVFEFDFSGWKTIGLSLMWIMFAYSGWNSSAYIGSEVRNPKRNLPRSLILGTGIVLILYLGLNLFYVYAVPPGEMAGVISIGGLAAGNLFGKSFESTLSLLISFALFSSLSAFLILGPRVYYAMACDRCFFPFASDVHSRFKVPSKSIFLQGLIASLMVLFGTFDQILTYMGFSLGIFPLLSVIGVFKVRRLKLSPYRLPGFPVVPVFYVLAGAAILVLGFFERPVESGIALAMAAVGIPVYIIFRKSL